MYRITSLRRRSCAALRPRSLRHANRHHNGRASAPITAGAHALADGPRGAVARTRVARVRRTGLPARPLTAGHAAHARLRRRALREAPGATPDPIAPASRDGRGDDASEHNRCESKQAMADEARALAMATNVFRHGLRNCKERAARDGQPGREPQRSRHPHNVPSPDPHVGPAGRNMIRTAYARPASACAGGAIAREVGR
jgi:hypothetical protein